MNKLIKFVYNISSKFPILNKIITEEFIRYFIIGFTSFLITYSVSNGVYFLALELRDFSQESQSILASTSFVIAYITSFSFNFTFSRKWTFQVKDEERRRAQLIKFFVVHFCSMIIVSLLVGVLENIGVVPLISVPVLAGIQMITSFFLYKFWVFR